MISDFQYVIRSLSRRKGFAIVAVLTLALGIGSATAIYAVVDWVLFQQPTYSSDLYSVDMKSKDGNGMPFLWYSQYEAYRNLADIFSDVSADSYTAGNVVVGARPVQSGCGSVGPGFLKMFSALPVLGREFTPSEYVEGKDDVVLIDHYFWQQYLGGTPDVLGRKVIFNQRICTVVGVFREGQKFPGFFNSSVVKPLILHANPDNLWDSIYTFVKLRPGVTAAQANSAISGTKVNYPAQLEYFAKTMTPALAPPDDIRKFMQPQVYWMLLGAVGFLYAIACLNVTNLILVHLLGKQREISIRMALGGGRLGLVRLLTIESLTICLLGSLLGAVAANWLIPLFSAATHTDSSTLSWNLGFRTYVALGGLTLLTGVIIAIVPALHILRSGIQAGLKTGGGSVGEGRALARLRSIFVILQSAFAVILLLGAGLMIRTFERLERVPLGFDPSHKTKIQVGFPPGFPKKSEDLLTQQKRLQQALQNVPGVTAVAFGSDSLLAGYEGVTMDVTIKDGVKLKVNGAYISEGFKDAGGLKLVAGRWLQPDSKHEVMINESFEKKVFGTASPLGQYVDTDWSKEKPKSDAGWLVVGVLADVRENLREAPGPKVYEPISKSPNVTSCYFVSSPSEPTGQFISSLQQALYACDPRVVSWSATPLAQARVAQIHNEQMALSVLRILSGIAILLTLVGMFSLMAFTVDRRMGEFGVRMALGASPSNLLSIVMRRGMTLTIIGLVIGIGGSVAMTKFIQSLLYETPAVDPMVTSVVAGMLVVSALAACALPALRASKPDLVRLLQSD